jgi:uncharacterized protein (DUF2141 family)
MILLLGIYSRIFSPEKDSGDVTVVMTDLRNNKGVIWVILYNSENDFLQKENKGYRRAQGNIVKNKSTVSFENLPYGHYAIAFMHDENSNKTMDHNKIKIPKEGFGISNNPKIIFGPPKYDAAKFIVNKNNMTVTIKTKYF